MNKNAEDQLTRQKMDGLGTLDGGIVFGKEEAWERLQERMDTIPVRKMPVKVWWAAAAIMLIIIFGAGIFYAPQTPINSITLTSDRKPKKVEESKISNAPIKVNTTPVPGERVKARDVKRVLVYNKPSISNKGKNESASVHPAPQQSIAAPAKNLPGIAGEKVSGMGHTTELKVVHINELASFGSMNYAQSLPDIVQPVVINKMKVVSFNDLEDNRSKKMMEEEEMRNQQQNVAKKLNNIITSKGYSTLNPLHKIKVNTQN